MHTSETASVCGLGCVRFERDLGLVHVLLDLLALNQRQLLLELGVVLELRRLHHVLGLVGVLGHQRQRFDCGVG